MSHYHKRARRLERMAERKYMRQMAQVVSESAPMIIDVLFGVTLFRRAMKRNIDES